MNKAVFLDRDHTIIEDPGYLSDPAGVKLLAGVAGAIRSLAAAGYKIVVVTNQSGVARGMLTEETLEKIHTELRGQLSADGADLDAIYYCPYHPAGTIQRYARESDLRKPNPGMLLKAAVDLELELSASWMVGDSPRDIQAGRRAGCSTIRLCGGDASTCGEKTDEEARADFTAANLAEAAEVILSHSNRAGSTEP